MNDARPQQALKYSKDIRILSNNTSVPKKYDWVEVYRDTTGNWNNMTMSKGNVTYDPAFERNNASTPANTVCRADRDPMTGQLIFTHRSQVVTNEQAPGLYSAWFFPLPFAFTFGTDVPAVYPYGKGVLYNKGYFDQVNGPQCARFAAHKTEVFYPNGTVYYTATYTADNPLNTTVTVPLPALPVGQYFKAKYTVYPYDGTIFQGFSQDTRYIQCPFTEFQAGTYGQIKYECSGLSPLINVGQPPDGTVWPPPNLVQLKIAPSTMNTSLSLSIGPNVGQAEYWKAQAVLNWINSVSSRAVPNLNAGFRAAVSIFDSGFQSFTDPIPSVTVGSDTYYMTITGSANQAFVNIPGMTNGFYPCDTQTQSGFTASEGGFTIKASWGPNFYPGRLGTYESYAPQDSPRNWSRTENPPFAVFSLYGVQFYRNSMSISFS